MTAASQVDKPQSRFSIFIHSDVALQIVWLCLWLLPNLMLRVATRELYTPSGLLNIDLLLFGAIALFLPIAWSPFLIVLAMSIDIVEGLLRTWYFRPEDLLPAAESLCSLPLERLCEYAGMVVLVFGGFGYAAWKIRLHTTKKLQLLTAVPLLAIGVLSLSFDILCGGRTFTGLRDSQSSFFMARTPERSLIRQARAIYLFTHDKGDGVPIDSASTHLLHELRSVNASQRPNIIGALVESWGTDNNGSIDQKILALYRIPRIQRQYRMIIDTVPFVGSTIFGETRELCNSTLGFGVSRSSSALGLRDCLPWKLRALGYRTEGVHGYFGGMYGRNLWYPRVGFETAYFKRRLHAEGLTDCQGAFPGVCDDQAAQWIGNHISQTKGPLFLHWVTLNSHLPVPTRIADLNPVPCDFDLLVAEKESLCSWFKLEYQVHSSIAGLASRDDIPPTAFVIVGDHAPPFASPDIRNRFVSDRVPYLLLIPRQLGTGVSSSLVIVRSQRPQAGGHAASRGEGWRGHPGIVRTSLKPTNRP